MSIPDYQTLMIPILKVCSDGKDHQTRSLVEQFVSEFGLSEDERTQLTSSGKVTVLRSRVGWARSYLKKAGLISYPSRGYTRITDEGLKVFRGNPDGINSKMLKKYPGFQEFTSRNRLSSKKTDASQPADSTRETPEESLERAYHDLRATLASELLDAIKENSPEFFERLVVELLVAMGYGGSIEDAGRTVGKSGDGGIDGIIQEDRLGLDSIYLQAKRWNSSTIGRPEIQKFVGALQGQRAQRGVFLTTAKFSKDARGYAESIDMKVVLIDGDQLTQLMIDFELGVSPFATYRIKRLDSDYFLED